MPRDPDIPATPAQHGATQRNNKKTSDPPDDSYLLSNNDLSPRQRTAIELLLRGFGDAEAAAQIGVDRGTIYRWRTRHPDFIDEFEQQRQIVWQQSAQRLQAMFQPALDILQKQLTGDDPRLALRAAALLLRVATPARLARLTQEPSPPRSPPSTPRPPHDNFADLLEAYINAPLPGEAGRQCDANAKSIPVFDEFDEDDLDEDVNEEADEAK